MLIGEFFNKVGEKNRIALPKKFRKLIGDSLIVTRGYEGCVVIVNKRQWQNLLSSFTDKPFIKSSIRDTRRFFIGGASEIKVDAQGRFVLPVNLKQYAEVKKEVVFVGLVDWIEIWDREKWNKRLEYLQKEAPKIAEKVDEIFRQTNDE